MFPGAEMSQLSLTTDLRRRVLGLLASVAVAGLLLVTPQVHAARICTITATPLAFGNYTPGTPLPVDSTTMIQVACVGDPDPG